MYSTLTRLFACMALFAGSMSNALGQGVPETEFSPKSVALIDARGVDLAQRNLSITHSISIGDSSNGMSYSVSYSSAGTWKFYQSVMAYARWDHLTDPETGSTADVWALNFRGASEAMEWSGTEYMGDLGSRLSLCANSACASSATLADGTVLTFDQTPVSVSASGVIFRLTSAVKPNGERLDYYYVPGGLAIRAITNNYGYQLRFANPNPNAGGLTPPTSVVLFNMATDACSPTAPTCTYSRTWPQLSFHYLSGSSVDIVTETSGDQTIYGYGPSSQRIESINAPGTRDTTISYQNCGPNPPSGQCNAGGEWVGSYRVQTVTIAGRSWTYSWDPALVQGTNPEHGVRVTHAAGYAGYRTGITPYFGNGVFELYPIADRMISVKDELSRITTYEYVGQLNPRVSKVTYPEGNGTQYGYDQRMNLTSIRNFAKPGSGLPDQYTYIERGESPNTTQCVQPAYCNKPLRVRDARGYVTRYDWSPTTGLLSTIETGLQGPSTSLTCYFGANMCPKQTYGYTSLNAYYFNSSGVIAAGPAIQKLTSITVCEYIATCSATDQVVTTLGYGATGVANNLLTRSSSTAKNAVARTSTFGYDVVGNRNFVDGPRTDVTDTTQTGWDLDRRPTDEVYADGSATRRTYTTEGYLYTLSRGTSTGLGQFTAYETSTFEYDAAGNPIKITKPYGITQMSYDSANRLLCSAVRMIPSAYNTLPTDACALSTTNTPVLDRITRYTYDAAGEITKIQKAYLTALVQDFAFRGYTSNGQLDWAQDANGNRTDYTYDGFDRLQTVTFPSATLGANIPNVSDYEQYGYDENGNRTTRRLRTGETITHYYDALNRESWRDIPGGVTQDIYNAYDLLGRLSWSRFQSQTGAGVDYTYDAWSGVKSETTFGKTMWFDYDSAGNRRVVKWPDLNYVEYTFDNMNRVDQVRENGATTIPGLLADYTYDAIGRRMGVAFGNATSEGWHYDSASRVDSLTQDLSGTAQDVVLGFTFNPANQIGSRSFTNTAYEYPAANTSLSYSPDGLNRYSNVAGVTYSYDGRGNLTNNGTRAFIYDLENHLTRVDGAVGTPTYLTLSYDPRGRISQSSGSAITTFLYAGDQLWAEYNSSGAVVRRYVHGATVDEPIVWYEGASLSSSTRQWLHADQGGSIIGVTNGSGALVGSTYSYSAYGEPNPAQGWTGSRFRYTGQIMLPDAQLYHYKARVYNPTIGRFLQTDPIGYGGGPNLYAYASNDAINRFDPGGNRDIFVGGAADKTSGIVRSYAEAFKSMPGNEKRDVYYVGGNRVKHIMSLINSTPFGEPINLIGHSWGAVAAAVAAGQSKRRIDLLVTIDPVGHKKAKDPSATSDWWINVTAKPSNSDFSDLVAAAGGKPPGNVDTSAADENFTVDTNHGKFATMMQTKSANKKTILERVLGSTGGDTVVGDDSAVCPAPIPLDCGVTPNGQCYKVQPR